MFAPRSASAGVQSGQPELVGRARLELDLGLDATLVQLERVLNEQTNKNLPRILLMENN